MTKKTRDFDKTIAMLNKKHDVLVDRYHYSVQVLNGQSTKSKFHLENDLGNGAWGAIDWLVNHLGFRFNWVAEFK